MIRRIIVAGCRDYENYEEAKKHIEACISEFRTHDDLTFLSGGCRGADRLGEKYANENGFSVGAAQNGANPDGFASISTKPQRKIRVPKSGSSINALAMQKNSKNHLSL